MAEDNRVGQRIAQCMFEKLGHTVEVAANGQEALKAAGPVTYDTILIDVNMPEMDGLVVTRIIRPLLPPLRIIAPTGGAMDEEHTACLERWVDDFLVKPVRPEDLDDAPAGADEAGAR